MEGSQSQPAVSRSSLDSARASLKQCLNLGTSVPADSTTYVLSEAESKVKESAKQIMEDEDDSSDADVADESWKLSSHISTVRGNIEKRGSVTAEDVEAIKRILNE